MAPVSVPAALVQQCVEALAGVALVQLVRPGTACVLGSFLSATDMKSGSAAFGGPESALGLYASGQTARRVPSADQIEAVLPLMPARYALAVVVLDATGMRAGELEERGLRCGDLDERNSRWRVRRAVEKGRRGRWVSLPPDLFAAVLASLPPREDRDPERPVFTGLTQERLRTAIARACKASGTPTWSPHDLRHRRISLWHRQGETWALIGARVGQRSLSVTADTYTHVLLDDRELDHAELARTAKRVASSHPPARRLDGQATARRCPRGRISVGAPVRARGVPDRRSRHA